MRRNLSKTNQLFQRAKKVIPNGVNSNFRYLGDDDTLIVTHAQGSHFYDADDNRYIDYRLAFGPIILGHADPRVTARVTREIQNGTLYAATTLLEIELAERFTRMTGMDKVRLANTGSEATMHALRIARAYAGRELFIKFDGQYHGMYDYVSYNTPAISSVQMGPRGNTRPVVTTRGIPDGIKDYLLTLPYNDIAALERVFKRRGEQIAAVMLEPVMGNTAGILPRVEWLQTLRRLCDEYGTVLIFDEVKTGFRIANGGAQEYFGVKADLAAYAKAMGNGYPIAAVAGTAAVMSILEEGDVAHGGTYVGNVVATAAANATLEILENEPVIETIMARGKALMNGLDDILTRGGIPHVLTGIPSMFGLLLGVDEAPFDFHSYERADHALYEELICALIERGAMPDDDSREPWFLCYAHSNQDIAETLAAFEDALTEVTHGHPTSISVSQRV